MKAEPRPTKDVTREGGTATPNGRWFERLVRRRSGQCVWSWRPVAYYQRHLARKLRLNLHEMFLRFKIVRLQLRNAFLRGYVAWLEFRVCLNFCLHNLVIYYRNKHTGDEPPNRVVGRIFTAYHGQMFEGSLWLHSPLVKLINAV